MTEVYVYFKKPPTGSHQRIRFVEYLSEYDYEVGLIDLEILLTLPNQAWPKIDLVCVLGVETTHHLPEGCYQFGGTRVSCDAEGLLTAQGKSVRQFIRTMRRIRNRVNFDAYRKNT